MEELNYTVGVDLGGTYTQYAVVDVCGNIIYKDKFPTRDYPDFSDYINKLAKCITEAEAATETIRKIKGVGIGAPCVNARTQCIDGATDLPWSGIIPIADMLGRKLDIPVSVSNDANAAAVGEMIYGCAKGMSDFIMLTLGTGVGSGIVCDRKILNGKMGFAGELGHMRFSFASDRLCGCGRYGCLQTVCSSKGMIATALKLLEQTETPSVLREVPQNKITAKMIGQAMQNGDEIACRTLRITEEALGKACAEFATFSNPEAIVLFGGVANSREMDRNHIEEVMNDHILHIYRGRIKVMFSSLPGADAAILGAASLPWQQ